MNTVQLCRSGLPSHSALGRVRLDAQVPQVLSENLDATRAAYGAGCREELPARSSPTSWPPSQPEMISAATARVDSASLRLVSDCAVARSARLIACTTTIDKLNVKHRLCLARGPRMTQKKAQE